MAVKYTKSILTPLLTKGWKVKGACLSRDEDIAQLVAEQLVEVFVALSTLLQTANEIKRARNKQRERIEESEPNGCEK